MPKIILLPDLIGQYFIDNRIELEIEFGRNAEEFREGLKDEVFDEIYVRNWHVECQLRDFGFYC